MKYICISGSRSIRQYWLFSRWMRDHLEKQEGDVTIIQGVSYFGIDYLARIFCFRNKVLCKGYPANWEELGKPAGMIRNKEMIDDANELIAFHDGISNGTKNAIELGHKKGIPVTVVTLKADDNWRNKRIEKGRRLKQLRKWFKVK